jgi:hypothetical protein
MAKKTIIDAITTLYSKLGGNLSDVLGTRSNVNFMGTGKSSEPFLDMDLNIEALGAISKSKALQELKSSVGFATADKLNDVQANKLLTNMMKMDEFYNPPAAPANITDLETGTRNLDAEGLGALRATADDLPPPGSRGGADDIAAPVEQGFAGFARTIRELSKSDPELAAQYKTVMTNKADAPVKRGTAREFLVEALKKENPNDTTFADIVSEVDVKFITEGGGGLGGDPLFLVEKYFGPRIVEALPSGASSEEIAIFTQRVLNNVVDARGLRPSDPNFDRLTATFIDETQTFANGGRVNFQGGGMDASSDDFNTSTKGADEGGHSRFNVGSGYYGETPTTNNNNDNNPPMLTINPVIEKDSVLGVAPTKLGLEALLSDKGRLKAVLDAQDSIEEGELVGDLTYSGNIGPVNINAAADLDGQKSFDIGYTKGGFNFDAGLDNEGNKNIGFTYSKTFAKGGLAKILEV